MIFAFGPGGDSFYINNGRQSCWRNIPSGLATLLRDDKRCSPEKVVGLALFPDEGYFLSATNGMWATNNVPAAIMACITTEAGGKDKVGWIHHDASDVSRYQIAAVYTPGRVKLFHNALPEAYLKTVAAELFASSKFVTTGYQGSWVLGLSDRTYYELNNEGVIKMILGQGKTVKDVTLSPYTAKHVFLEYTDGTVNYLLPKEWHRAIQTVVDAANKPQAATSSATSEGDGLAGFASYVTKEVGKEIGKEVGKDIIEALFEAIFN